jgi:hypothetical protein
MLPPPHPRAGPGASAPASPASRAFPRPTRPRPGHANASGGTFSCPRRNRRGRRTARRHLRKAGT